MKFFNILFVLLFCLIGCNLEKDNNHKTDNRYWKEVTCYRPDASILYHTVTFFNVTRKPNNYVEIADQDGTKFITNAECYFRQMTDIEIETNIKMRIIR